VKIDEGQNGNNREAAVWWAELSAMGTTMGWGL